MSSWNLFQAIHAEELDKFRLMSLRGRDDIKDTAPGVVSFASLFHDTFPVDSKLAKVHYERVSGTGIHFRQRLSQFVARNMPNLIELRVCRPNSEDSEQEFVRAFDAKT